MAWQKGFKTPFKVWHTCIHRKQLSHLMFEILQFYNGGCERFTVCSARTYAWFKTFGWMWPRRMKTYSKYCMKILPQLIPHLRVHENGLYCKKKRKRKKWTILKKYVKFIFHEYEFRKIIIIFYFIWKIYLHLYFVSSK